MESNKNLMNEEFTNFIHDIIDKDLEEGVCKKFIHVSLLSLMGIYI